jgi:hypothetical protein
LFVDGCNDLGAEGSFWRGAVQKLWANVETFLKHLLFSNTHNNNAY